MTRRITVVTSELLGRAGTGGAGTADSLLAVALARHGHGVELLVASGRDIGSLSAEWTHIYESAGVDLRILTRMEGVRPAYLAPTLEVYRALREQPPDLVIVDDWRGLGWAAMRARQAGLALTETAFVVHCHGPARVLAEFAQKVPDTLARFGEEVTERTSIELADAVVSPSAWLLGWMHARGWPVPDAAQAIQLVRQSVALDEAPLRAPAGVPIGRVAFFGQLREGKGIRIFLEALAALEPRLLEGKEILFLGSATSRWPTERIMNALGPVLEAGLTGVHVHTELEREQALEELCKPGTLAVMPSLLDNAPNTVSECIEHGVPFVAARTGGIPELVAVEDQSRVLCEPTAQDLARVLSVALASQDGFETAKHGRDPGEALAAWLELAESVSPARRERARPALQIGVVATDDAGAEHAHRLAQNTHTVEVEIVRAESRRDGLARTAAEWVLFLDGDDEPDDELLDTLVAAQATSRADVVTAAVRPADDPGGIQLFLGDPGALGLTENQYGVLGLLRSELAAAEPLEDGGRDPDWLLFARLALAGARIVSLPEALSVHQGRPGRVGDVPGEGLRVLAAFEEHHNTDLQGLPQLAATLAAAKSREAPRIDGLAPTLMTRGITVLRRDGVGEFLRRSTRLIRRILSPR
jgi:glycosyltransferase involved in cell wall biosynthesis